MMYDIGTQTTEDAYRRIYLARLGSTAGKPTVAYLESLRTELSSFMRIVEDKLREVIQAEADREEAETESYRSTYDPGEEHIGYLLGGEVRCCACSPHGWGGAAKLYAVNIVGYKQSCHECGKVIKQGQTPAWCELFTKPESK